MRIRSDQARPLEGHSSRTILVVDDDAAVRGALKFLLEVEGLDVRLYSDAAALLAEPSLPSGSCAVVDYRMPNMDGLQLTDRLRERHAGLPVILITGHVSQDLRRRAEKAGVRAVLEKPLLDGAILEGIRSVLATAT